MTEAEGIVLPGEEGNDCGFIFLFSLSASSFFDIGHGWCPACLGPVYNSAWGEVGVLTRRGEGVGRTMTFWLS